MLIKNVETRIYSVPAVNYLKLCLATSAHNFKWLNIFTLYNLVQCSFVFQMVLYVGQIRSLKMAIYMNNTLKDTLQSYQIIKHYFQKEYNCRNPAL